MISNRPLIPPEYAKIILMMIRIAITIQIHLIAFWVRLWKRKLMQGIVPELSDYLNSKE
jgi:hypothetical protein